MVIIFLIYANHNMLACYCKIIYNATYIYKIYMFYRCSVILLSNMTSYIYIYINFILKNKFKMYIVNS